MPWPPAIAGGAELYNMKKCPTCEKTFDDNLRFCQADGTPLVDAPPPIDPYKTMVARPEDIAAAIPQTPAEVQPPAPVDEPVLEIPPVEVDPKKTMYASEEEIRSAMAEVSAPEEPIIEMPPVAEPEPPQFIAPDIAAGEPSQPPPSPFSQSEPEPQFRQTTPPIPSPFDMPKFDSPEPEPPAFVQPEAFNPPAADLSAPIVTADQSPMPAAQEQNWQEQQMQNPQFSQGAPAAAGPNQTLAIVSLVIGILSLLCCTAFIPGIVAIVLGFMARGKANSDPANYGGGGLALGGIIAGGVSLLIGAVFWILYALGFAASMMGNMR